MVLLDLLNTVVVQDDSVKLTCDSPRNSSCMWYHGDYTSKFNEGQKLVFNGRNISTPYISRFSVDLHENNTLCALNIRSARVTDAGVFICQILPDDSSSFSPSAQLIVLGMFAMLG